MTHAHNTDKSGRIVHINLCQPGNLQILLWESSPDVAPLSMSLGELVKKISPLIWLRSRNNVINIHEASVSLIGWWKIVGGVSGWGWGWGSLSFKGTCTQTGLFKQGAEVLWCFIRLVLWPHGRFIKTSERCADLSERSILCRLHDQPVIRTYPVLVFSFRDQLYPRHPSAGTSTVER